MAFDDTKETWFVPYDCEAAKEYYYFTANCLPKKEKCYVLDLCFGEGVELEEYFKLCPDAKITCIDLSREKADILRKKFYCWDATFARSSLLELRFGSNVFDVAVSVNSLHRFTLDEKILLYRKMYGAIKQEGYFVLTDCFAASDEEEDKYRSIWKMRREEQRTEKSDLCHRYIPHTVKHEIEAVLESGFSMVEILNSWGTVYTLKATK